MRAGNDEVATSADPMRSNPSIRLVLTIERDSRIHLDDSQFSSGIFRTKQSGHAFTFHSRTLRTWTTKPRCLRIGSSWSVSETSLSLRAAERFPCWRIVHLLVGRDLESILDNSTIHRREHVTDLKLGSVPRKSSGKPIRFESHGVRMIPIRSDRLISNVLTRDRLDVSFCNFAD